MHCADDVRPTIVLVVLIILVRNTESDVINVDNDIKSDIVIEHDHMLTQATVMSTKTTASISSCQHRRSSNESDIVILKFQIVLLQTAYLTDYFTCIILP